MTDDQLETHLFDEHRQLRYIQRRIKYLEREKQRRVKKANQASIERRRMREERGFDPDGSNELTELLRTYDAIDDERTYPHNDEDTRLWKKLDGEYYLYRQRGGQYPKFQGDTGKEYSYLNYPLHRETWDVHDRTWLEDWEHCYPTIGHFLQPEYREWFKATHEHLFAETEREYPWLSIQAARAVWKIRRLQHSQIVEDELSSYAPAYHPRLPERKYLPRHLFNKTALIQLYKLRGITKYDHDRLGDEDYLDIPPIPMCDIWINEIMTEEQQKRTQLAERYYEQTMGRADEDYEYILLMNPFASTPDLWKFIIHQAAATDPQDIDQETFGRKPTGKRY